MYPVGKSAEVKFEEAFEDVFMKKAEKPPEVDTGLVPGTQKVNADDDDPGEVGDQWAGEDPEQYSSAVDASARETREGELQRVFVTPPSPKGTFKKVAHAPAMTVQERVRRLCNRR